MATNTRSLLFAGSIFAAVGTVTTLCGTAQNGSSASACLCMFMGMLSIALFVVAIGSKK